MLHLAAALTAQVTADAAPDAAQVGILVILIAFFAAFFVLGAVFLKKKRAERVAALTAELEKPDISGELPPLSEEPVPVLGGAQDLLDAERKAAVLKAEADAARRATERAQAIPDSDAAALHRNEQEARARAEAAQKEARSLRLALGKTRDGLLGKLAAAVGQKAIDAAVLDDIEAVLFGADIGARTSERLLQAVRARLSKKELSSLARIEETLRDEANKILATVQARPLDLTGDTPRVVLVLGVNGAGKTTTIGKLAAQIKTDGKKVLLGAGDTFRAAAADQLEVWAGRAGVPIVTGADGADPSSVLFDAVKKARDEGFDVVLCDTAGRLHTKVNLMEELKKVVRSLQKACAGAPHEVLLVLDATVGQNAIAQAKQFGEAAALTGIVLTKLDGTAKGGVVLGIVDELKIPVRYIGVGEKITDLRPFVASEFVDALFSNDGGAPRAAA